MTSIILNAFTMSKVENFDPSKPVLHNTPYVHKEYAYKYKWLNIFIYTAMHVVFFYSIQLHLTTSKWQSNVFAWVYGIFGGLGLTAGVHRLWAHKSYKANLPLRILLAISHSISNQQSIYRWVRDHRTHHKYSDTDADPHDPRRGFVFAHIGWLVITKRPAVIEGGKTIDMSDILNDPVASFQTKYNSIIGPFFCFLLPTFIPWYFWGESLKVAFLVCALGKYTITSNINWSINSFAHTLGMRPYDRTKGGTQSKILNVFAFGEGWHNYHHAFPWDYASAELGLEKLNFTKQFIDLFAKIGWASDRKRVPLDVVKRRVLKIGDGSHHFAKELDEMKYKECEDEQLLENDKKFSVETP